MKRNNKKGFTIVELVIVIAVIAILAAVLIPTFSSVIKKAKVNNDIQLVRNLNTALATDTEEHKTMQDALDAAAEFGYDIDKINASATDNEILWDSVNDCFVYKTESGIEYIPNSKKTDEEVKDYQFWQIADELPATQTYSIYAGTGWTAETVDITVGFDAGTTKGITAIEYKNTTATPQEVVICTNGGTLTIDAEQDDIAHYGYADSVNIVAVAPDTYRENGKVGFTQIAKGHYVAEAGAEVLVVLATGSADDVTIDNNGATIDKAYTTVATSQNTLHGGNESLAYYKVTPTETQTQEEALAEAIKNLETGATLFAGGTGSQEDPFLISNREELENIYMSHMTGYVGTYYKVKDGVNKIDCSNWTPIWIEANFDGNGVTLTNLDAPLFKYVGYNYDSPVFRNFNVVANMHYNADRAAIITYNYAKTQVTLESVNVSGIIESSLGASTYFGYGKSTINLIDCISTANLVATGGGVSGIVNHPRYGAGTETYINIIDSAFVGSMSYKDGTPGYFGTEYWSAAVTVKYSNEFISKYGNPNGTLYNQPAGSADENGVITFTGTNSMQYIATGKSATLTAYSIDLPNVGESFSVAKISGASEIVVTLEIGANDENGYGNYVATYEIEEIDVSGYDTGDTITTNKIKNFEIVVVPANNTDKVTGAAGATYYVVSGRNGSTYGSAVVRITQYDSVGNVIGSSSVSIKK